MDIANLFDIWAPRDSIWSPWAKPVLFAQADAQGPLPEESPVWRDLQLPWVPAAAGATGLIIDLPGPNSVVIGLALALRGYRPVPLYNCARGPDQVVLVDPIVRLLLAGVADLGPLHLPPNAPPAFLLDSNRLGNVSLAPGRFDNRWLVFPQDFPSANFLLAHDIGCVLLVQNFVQPPMRDLAHVLLRWQQNRIALMNYGLQSGGPLQPMTVSKPSHFKQLWYRALVLAGLRRHSGGGFGAVVPDAGGSGSG